MKTNLSDIGARIQKIRADKGLTQVEMGLHLGVKGGAVSKYEKGDADPGAIALAQIASLGGVSLDWLITGEGEAGEPERSSGAPTGFEKELIRLVIEAVEEGLGDLHQELKPDKKAQLVITLCEMFEEEKQVDKPTILRLIKLAA